MSKYKLPACAAMLPNGQWEAWFTAHPRLWTSAYKTEDNAKEALREALNEWCSRPEGLSARDFEISWFDPRQHFSRGDTAWAFVGKEYKGTLWPEPADGQLVTILCYTEANKTQPIGDIEGYQCVVLVEWYLHSSDGKARIGLVPEWLKPHRISRNFW